MKKYILLILTALSVISCSKNNSSALITKKNVSIPIDINTSYKSRMIHIQDKNDTTYFIRKNTFTNSILIYNWNTHKKVETYTFETEGSNRIIKFDTSGFIEIEDGIFLIGTARSQVYIVKNDSVIYKSVFDKTGYGFGAMINGFNKNLPILIENEVYFFRKPPVPIVDKTYYDYNLLTKFNLETKTLYEINVKYPKTYKKGECWGFSHLRQSFTLNNKSEIIFSFPIDSNLYKYDITNNSFQKISSDLKSKFKPTYIPMPCHDLNDEKYQYYIKASTRYESIKYDKYKDIYYRIILLKPNNLTMANAVSLDYKISIMVLDSNFKILSEDLLPLGRYDFDDFFVTKEGLWLSTNNPNNPNFNDEIMSFDLFTLKDTI